MSQEFSTYYDSPVGKLIIGGTKNSINSILFDDEKCLDFENYRSNEYLNECIRQLDEYFNFNREVFDLNLDPSGSEFQKKVWNELIKIPYGKTISYIEFAQKLGDAKVIRAAAKANSQNNIAIIIPCHRVIGANGDLVGYAGGLWRKKWLIEHESKKYGEQLSLL